ncbi:MAG: hypothetical protein FJY29_00785 [Betaproteobacteria bacterium]|nr:hypothetical protein [Betaproteobacteria bacterium]
MFRHLKFTALTAGLFVPAALVLAFGIVSCGDKKSEPAPAPDLTKFSGIYSSYLKSCGECHEPGNVAYSQKVTNLDMSTEEAAFTSLLLAVQVKKQDGFGCAERNYVKAGSPSTSYLYAIMDTATREAFATGSDQSCTPLLHVAEFDAAGNNIGGAANKPTAEQKEAIRSWIERGAPRN